MNQRLLSLDAFAAASPLPRCCWSTTRATGARSMPALARALAWLDGDGLDLSVLRLHLRRVHGHEPRAARAGGANKTQLLTQTARRALLIIGIGILLSGFPVL